MCLEIKVKDYLSFLSSFSNLPLSLDLLSSPFHINLITKESDFLYVGHFIDYLLANKDEEDLIDFDTVLDLLSNLESLEEEEDLIENMELDLENIQFLIDSKQSNYLVKN